MFSLQWDKRSFRLTVGVFGLLLLGNLLRRRLRLSGKIRATPVVMFSKFMKDVANDRVKNVLIAPDHFVVQLKPLAEDIALATQSKSIRENLLYKTTKLPLGDGSDIVKLLLEKNVNFGSSSKSMLSSLFPVLLGLLPFIYLALTYRLLGRMLGHGEDGVGKSKNGKRVSSASNAENLVRFGDVAGVDEAKLELQELVEFLKNPEKFYSVGARMPKGILLSGPSGTGKTLLARALAHEADVPFLYCSASDFVEMLVGRGAARVRDLFTRAAEQAPCIIFIDEIDALAQARGGINSNEEREQTLNQLLTEMDGFEPRAEGMVVLAATNRPQVLDPALCRPGRFDRHLVVALPDLEGRKEILKVHTRNVATEGVSLDEIARCSAGRSGAELAALVNDAALLAVRAGKKAAGPQEFAAAISRAHKARTAMGSFWTMSER